MLKIEDAVQKHILMRGGGDSHVKDVLLKWVSFFPKIFQHGSHFQKKKKKKKLKREFYFMKIAKEC